MGRCIVFNLGGNKYRMVAAIHYNRGAVYVRHVLTHAQCGGHANPKCEKALATVALAANLA